MKRSAITLGLALATLMAIPTARATDEFGSNFTAAAPAALEDKSVDFTGEDVSTIEPAAGGEVFLSPEEEDAGVVPGSDLLAPPEQPLVPGMTATPENTVPVLKPAPATE